MKLLALLSTAAALSPSKLDRRNALKFGGAALATTLTQPAVAAAPATVFVAGATGQTGRRVLERLAAKGGSVVAGVRDTKKAEKTLAEASTVVRGAMVQKVDAVDTKGVRLAKLDVVAMWTNVGFLLSLHPRTAQANADVTTIFSFRILVQHFLKLHNFRLSALKYSLTL